MKLYNFVWTMCKKLGLGGHEVRVVKDEKYIFKGTFEELLEANIPEAEVQGVSMMLTASKSGQYSTLISI